MMPQQKSIQSSKFLWNINDLEWGGGGNSKTNTRSDYQRQPKGIEKRVDFAALEKLYSLDATQADAKVRAALRQARDELIKQVEAAGKDNRISPWWVATLKLGTGDVAKILQEYLVGVWRKSRDLAMKEMPTQVKDKLEPLKRYSDEEIDRAFISTDNGNSPQAETKSYATGFEPQLALDYFASRAIVLKGIIDQALLNQAKLRLMEYLKGGETLTEVIGNLRAVFEPWVGDPTKIQPSGQVGIGFPPGTSAPENILMAYRLENIIRTETTTAMSQGRLAVGDAAGDYVVGYQLSAILDDRTTAICQEADGLMFSKDDLAAQKLLPPLHFQCRTVPIFVTTDDAPVKWSTRARIDKVVRLIPSGFK